MNREIKYRAWDKVKKEFIDFNKIGFLEDGSMWYLQGLDEYENEIDPPYFEDDDTWVLLQFTGLKDKNGVGIYEGDVVHFKTDGLSGKGFVYLDEEVAQFWIEDIREQTKKRGKRYYPFYKDGTYRIVGNIYENPELLESAK